MNAIFEPSFESGGQHLIAAQMNPHIGLVVQQGAAIDFGLAAIGRSKKITLVHDRSRQKAGAHAIAIAERMAFGIGAIPIGCPDLGNPLIAGGLRYF